jgi:MerR family transcriptional regulator, redox-sensitive transcriptional activator SoxR
MAMTISEVAGEVGLRPSAIRYYEELGILAPAERWSGQRRYDRTAVYRLTVVRRAQQAGFSLDEIRKLFFGFGKHTRASARWKKLTAAKLAELKSIAREIEAMQALLKRLQKCPCDSLERCGRGMFEHGRNREPLPSIVISPRKRR